MESTRRVFLFAAVPTVLLVFAGTAFAIEPSKDGWYHTGDAVRVKTMVFVKIRAYAISHYMRALPATKSKRAVIDIDTDKQLSFRMLRDVGADKIKNMFRDAFAENGYADAAAINSFIAVFSKDLKTGTKTTVAYDPIGKATTITTDGGGTATITGLAFMRATWSVWFGKNDQPSLGDGLISNI